MKNLKTVWLTLGLMLFVNLAFADLPGGGVRWPAKRIQFSNISSLGKFALHVNYENAFVQDTITRDTTYLFPEHQGSPGPSLKSFFAILNNISTDTVEIDSDDMEIIFTGIKNNRLQFLKKINTGSITTPEELNKEDNPDNVSHVRFNKVYIGLSVLAFAGLILLFRFIKRENQKNINNTPSA